MQRLVTLLVLFAIAGAGCGGQAVPDDLREGRSIYGETCSPCHGSVGQGGVGPALDAVLVTWPSCSDHIEWITLGSDGWREAYGDTYGAPGRTVKGGMPAHGSKLSPEEVAAVAAFERSQYGGEAVDAALADCGAT